MSYIGQRPVVGRYIKLDQISSGFNGSNTSFSMTSGSQAVFPGTARNLLLSLGGVIQEPDTSFTISGSTLTFTTAPVANTTFFAVIFGDMQSTGTPSDGTVLPASIASSGNFSFPQLTVTGTSSLGDDVTFTGANYNVVWDKSDNCLEFTDNAKAKFGTGSDLEIYHDGSQSYIKEGGTGDLYIQSSAIILEATNGENYFKGIANGAAQVYYDGVSKLQTTSTGIIVTAKTQIEGGSGDTELILKRTNTAGSNGNSFGTIKFNDENSNIIGRISTVRSTAADDGDITFAARPTGGSVTEYLRIKSGGDIKITGDKGLYIGANEDLLLAHDGSLTRISDTFGHMKIASNVIEITNQTLGENYIKATNNGAVELYYDNSKKFETTSYGSLVTGRLNTTGNISMPDNAQIHLGDSIDLAIYHDGSHSYINNTTGNLNIYADTLQGRTSNDEYTFKAIANGAVELYYDNSKKLETKSYGVLVTGYISASPTSGNLGFHAGDNTKMTFGSSDDLQIYHDGSHSNINNSTGNLRLQTDAFRVNSQDNNESIIRADKDGAVELYYDNSKKFETTSSGASFLDNVKWLDNKGARFGGGEDLQIYHSSNENIIGVATTGQDIFFKSSSSSALDTTSFVVRTDGSVTHPDNIKSKWGTSDDLQIYHDGSHSYIEDSGTGVLHIATSSLQVVNAAKTEFMMNMAENGAVELYYDNSKKLETTSVGVTMNDTVITNGEIRPASDNNHSIGRSNRRYITYFGVNSPVNTSDKNEKNTIIDSDLGLDFINKLKPISYKWNKDDGKTHYGLIAQDLEETLTSLGKTIADFGGIYKEDDSPMGLGYSELIAPLIKAVQELSTEVAALKAA